jgi:hypothetical protein
LNKGSWDEPTVPDARKYPYNHVRESETGLIEEWDDTPANSRFHRYHPTGTFIEEHKNGDSVRTISNNNYTITMGDDFAHIKGNCNITVNGDASILVNGDSRLETKGNRDEWVHGNYNLKVGGTINQTSGGTSYYKSSFCVLNGTTPALNY